MITNKKICILTSVHPAFDTRIFHKEAETLAKADYDVILIGQHNKNEIVDGVKIIALPTPKNRFERITKVLGMLFSLALKESANIYHFHDPELIPVGLLLKLLIPSSIIYDVHEDVSEGILTKEWLGNVNMRKIVSVFFHIFEQFSVKLFNRVIAATPHIEKKFPKSKTIALRNLPILELIDNVKATDCKNDKPVIIYAGGLARIRGIKEIIEAMEFVKDKAQLLLLGEWESEDFMEECESLEGWKYIKYLGFVPFGKHYSFVKIANIGMVNFFPLPNQEDALPTKCFEYMACSLPIVMSNFSYWQKVFGECALFANPYDVEDIAEKVLHLLDNPDKGKELGKKGRQLIEEKYSWEAEQRKLLDIYEEELAK